MSTTAALPTPVSNPPAGPPALTLDGFLGKYAGATVDVVKGVVEEIPMPQPRHGGVCFKAAMRIGGFVEERGLGLVCTNDTFVLIRRDPLQIRGAGVAYWGKSKAPEGAPAKGMIEAPPDLCVEVVSPTNTWAEVFTKVGEYLGCGVTAVVVLDPGTSTASVCRDQPGTPQQIFNRSDALTLPDVLPGFSTPVRAFFE